MHMHEYDNSYCRKDYLFSFSVISFVSLNCFFPFLIESLLKLFGFFDYLAPQLFLLLLLFLEQNRVLTAATN